MMEFEQRGNTPPEEIEEVIEIEVLDTGIQPVIGVGRPAEIFGAKVWREKFNRRERGRQLLREQGIARGLDGSIQKYARNDREHGRTSNPRWRLPFCAD